MKPTVFQTKYFSCYPAYTARCQLTAIDYMKHKD